MSKELKINSILGISLKSCSPRYRIICIVYYRLGKPNLLIRSLLDCHKYADTVCMVFSIQAQCRSLFNSARYIKQNCI